MLLFLHQQGMITAGEMIAIFTVGVRVRGEVYVCLYYGSERKPSYGRRAGRCLLHSRGRGYMICTLLIVWSSYLQGVTLQFSPHRKGSHWKIILSLPCSWIISPRSRCCTRNNW
jgi:hypothetical protein